MIPTLNASKRLPIILTSLLSQTEAIDEIIIVDSSSSDGTVEVASSFDLVRVFEIDRSEFNHGATRHRALASAKGELVCFLTDDAVPFDNEYIHNLIVPFRDPKVAMVSGRQVPKQDARRFEQLVRLYNYPVESHVYGKEDVPIHGVKTFFASDSCSAYRRSAYMDVGGFKSVNTNEDMLIAADFIRNGYKVAYACDAIVTHSHNLSIREQYRRNKEIGFFLATHSAALMGVDETSDGMALAGRVLKQLIAERNLAEAASFLFDCGARFLGNRVGKRSAGIIGMNDVESMH